jgi:hypothetical protein
MRASVFILGVGGKIDFYFFVLPDVPYMFLYGVPSSNSHRKYTSFRN